MRSGWDTPSSNLQLGAFEYSLIQAWHAFRNFGHATEKSRPIHNRGRVDGDMCFPDMIRRSSR